MDTKIFSSLIVNEKITPHLELFLNKAFSFSSSSVQTTKWIAREKYRGGLIKKGLVKNALVKNGLDAITLNREVIYSGEEVYAHKEEDEFAAWLELIVHEQFHRNEIEKLGWVFWYFRYGIESLRKGYRNAPSEKRAYAVAMGDHCIMENFLKSDSGREFISVCKDEYLSQEEKNRMIERITVNVVGN